MSRSKTEGNVDSKELMILTLKSMDIELDISQYKLFERYTDILLDWNERINLTAITDRNDIVLKHFCDSLSVLKFLGDVNGKSLLDIGSGAGFPGVPLKIVSENLNITLMDSLKKRVNFLENLIAELNLKNASALHLRAEDAAHNVDYRQKYDIVVSRAVSRLNVLCEYCLPFVKKGGIFVAYKGPDVQAELNEAKNCISLLGGKYVKSEYFKISEIGRNLIFISKISDTSIKYPRKQALINKSPII